MSIRGPHKAAAIGQAQVYGLRSRIGVTLKETTVSNKAITWAFKQDLDSPTKFVLVVLADLADEKDSCFPGQQRIARATGSSERSVRRAVGKLEAGGFITRRQRRKSDGSRSSDRYFLELDWPLKRDRDDCA